jgi:TolB-like protein
MTPAPDVFLSYNREDQATAKCFANAFAAAGLSVWWDTALHSGEAYDEVTENALHSAKAVVVLWSPRSVSSRWVRAEATVADQNKTLVPVTIEACRRPVMFELTQTADLSQWRGETGDPVWEAFLDDVRRMVGRSEPTPSQAATKAAAPKSGARLGPPFVALVPLAHRGGGEELETLAEDLTEEIIRELTQASLFKVIATGIMSARRRETTDYRALRQELDAVYVVEGKVQSAGEEVRLTLQLIDTETGGMLKSVRHTFRLSNFDAAPEEAALAVATALGEEIEQLEQNRAMARSGQPSGWEHLLRAMAYSRRAGSESNERAVEEARQSVASIPDLGLAHGLLAHTLAAGVVMGFRAQNHDQNVEIQTHARRAMQLDGDNPAVFAQLASTYTIVGDTETGLQLAERAVHLKPHSPDSLFWLAGQLAGSGRTVEAIAVLDNYERHSRHHRHRPVALWIRGMCQFLDGHLPEAAIALDQSLAIHPDFVNALKWKAIVLASRGEEQAATAIVRRLKDAEPTMTLEHHVRHMLLLPKIGARSSEAVSILRRLWELTESGA